MIDFIIMAVVMFAVSYAMRPKPKSSAGAKPATEFDVPTAEEGRPIPVLFGTRRITGPNVVWWGDVKTQAIRR